MTYYDIVKQALAHLEYGTDEDSVSTYAERFMIYINDAVRQIAAGLKTSRVESVTLDNGCFTIGDFDKEVSKIEEVFIGNRSYPFVRGDELGDIKVIGCAPDATVNVRYRYLPSYVTDGDQEPEIPKIFHPIIYLYVVHCYHNSRATSSDYDRTKWRQEFELQRKRIMKQAYGALDTYSWKNRPWETGEM